MNSPQPPPQGSPPAPNGTVDPRDLRVWSASPGEQPQHWGVSQGATPGHISPTNGPTAQQQQLLQQQHQQRQQEQDQRHQLEQREQRHRLQQQQQQQTYQQQQRSVVPPSSQGQQQPIPAVLQSPQQTAPQRQAHEEELPDWMPLENQVQQRPPVPLQMSADHTRGAYLAGRGPIAQYQSQSPTTMAPFTRMLSQHQIGQPLTVMGPPTYVPTHHYAQRQPSPAQAAQGSPLQPSPSQAAQLAQMQAQQASIIQARQQQAQGMAAAQAAAMPTPLAVLQQEQRSEGSQAQPMSALVPLPGHPQHPGRRPNSLQQHAGAPSMPAGSSTGMQMRRASDPQAGPSQGDMLQPSLHRAPPTATGRPELQDRRRSSGASQPSTPAVPAGAGSQEFIMQPDMRNQSRRPSVDEYALQRASATTTNCKVFFEQGWQKLVDDVNQEYLYLHRSFSTTVEDCQRRISHAESRVKAAEDRAKMADDKAKAAEGKAKAGEDTLKTTMVAHDNVMMIANSWKNKADELLGLWTRSTQAERRLHEELRVCTEENKRLKATADEQLRMNATRSSAPPLSRSSQATEAAMTQVQERISPSMFTEFQENRTARILLESQVKQLEAQLRSMGGSPSNSTSPVIAMKMEIDDSSLPSTGSLSPTVRGSPMSSFTTSHSFKQESDVVIELVNSAEPPSATISSSTATADIREPTVVDLTSPSEDDSSPSVQAQSEASAAKRVADSALLSNEERPAKRQRTPATPAMSTSAVLAPDAPHTDDASESRVKPDPDDAEIDELVNDLEESMEEEEEEGEDDDVSDYTRSAQLGVVFHTFSDIFECRLCKIREVEQPTGNPVPTYPRDVDNSVRVQHAEEVHSIAWGTVSTFTLEQALKAQRDLVKID